MDEPHWKELSKQRINEWNKLKAIKNNKEYVEYEDDLPMVIHTIDHLITSLIHKTLHLLSTKFIP